MIKRIFGVVTMLVFVLSILVGCDWNQSKNMVNEIKSNTSEIINGVKDYEVKSPFEYLRKMYDDGDSFISTKNQIKLIDTNGKKKNYTFKYNGENYTATYTKDNWHIVNSYKIRNRNDITLICEVLIDSHPIHGADMKSYRTVEDLRDEWVWHNIAYDYLPDGNKWKSHAKDVDLNPADQGKSLEELFEMRAYN